MNIKQILYDHSPVIIQNVMTSIAGLFKNIDRYGKKYYEHRDFLLKFDKLTHKDQLNYQNTELKKFLVYAVKNSLFYQELYKNIDINEINHVNDLSKLPIVDKELLRKNIENVNTINRKEAVISHTGGTTGKSLEVFFTKEDSMLRMAQLDHFKAKVGFENLKMRKATFSGNHIIPPSNRKNNFWRYNYFSKQMLYSSFHITEKNIPYYIDSLNKFKPEAIDGFFSSILDLANYILRHNIDLEFQPIAIFPTSETLTIEGRKLIEQAFNAKVYDQYASSEGAPFITECPKQRLHINVNTGVFEIIDNNEILVTSFTTHGTPLIRYRIGDKIIMDTSDNYCSCGSQLPLVSKIIGRALDFLYTTDGAKVNLGNISNIFKNIPNAIVKSQLIQSDYDKLTVKIVVDENFKEKYINDLIIECKHKFGSTMNVNVKIVDDIPRAKSGKYKYIINKLVK